MEVHFNENFRPSAGVIILTPEGVIMVKEKKENFTRFPSGDKKRALFKLPGGKFDASLDSDIRDTAIRETQEETGLNLFYQRDQISLVDVIIRSGFRHSIFFIPLSFVPIIRIRENEIEDVKIISPDEWKEMRKENEILFRHARVVENTLPGFKGYIEPVFA